LKEEGSPQVHCCFTENCFLSQKLVADACNPSYSGSRDEEDLGLKPAPGK
jgi:hypothetical protein